MSLLTLIGLFDTNNDTKVYKKHTDWAFQENTPELAGGARLPLRSARQDIGC